jgi:alkylation response protein AidB-like acyl-CoA dehydrogenase
MDLLPDADQAAIAATVRDMAAALSPPARLRTLNGEDGVTDAKLWEQAVKQGLFSLHLPETAGGAALGLAELSLVFSELGRGLVAGPFLGTVVAARLAHLAGDRDLLAQIIAGLKVGLLERADAGRVRTFDAADAQAWLLIGPGGTEFYDAGAIVAGNRRRCVDPASRWAEASVAGAPRVRIAAGPFDALAYGSVLIAAMLAGICAATRDASASYAKTREQFGVPIGSFQAVKHRCADAAVRAEAATQLVSYAALTLDDGHPAAGLYWSAARFLSAEYAIANASDNIQNHGGMGLTYEADPHLYLKRAQVLASTLVPDDLRARILSAPPHDR